MDKVAEEIYKIFSAIGVEEFIESTLEYRFLGWFTLFVEILGQRLGIIKGGGYYRDYFLSGDVVVKNKKTGVKQQIYCNVSEGYVPDYVR